MQVLTSVAQAADLMAPLRRFKPLHVVADSRGPLLHEFVERLHILRARTGGGAERVLLTTDILPTEDLTAGVNRISLIAYSLLESSWILAILKGGAICDI